MPLAQTLNDLLNKPCKLCSWKCSTEWQKLRLFVFSPCLSNVICEMRKFRLDEEVVGTLQLLCFAFAKFLPIWQHFSHFLSYRISLSLSMGCCSLCRLMSSFYLSVTYFIRLFHFSFCLRELKLLIPLSQLCWWLLATS